MKLHPIVEQIKAGSPERPLIIDGGLASALENSGYKLHPTLWSAGTFIQHPEAVEDRHIDYLAAGADIIITAAYQMTFQRLKEEGYDHAQAEELLLATTDIARAARRKFLGASTPVRKMFPPCVAASIGPYGAYLADGSEYRGDYSVDALTLRDFHEERFKLLAFSGADLLAIETVPNFTEAEVYVDLLERYPDTPAWISFSCRDREHISDGTPITKAAKMLDDVSSVVAIGINCTNPEYVESLITAIRSVSAKSIVVYPNSGEVWAATARNWAGTGTPQSFFNMAKCWQQQGAVAIGGCCRVGIEDIRKLASIIV